MRVQLKNYRHVGIILITIGLFSFLPRVLSLGAAWSSDETIWLFRSQNFMVSTPAGDFSSIPHLNQSIGKQDQYIAAYGGLRRIQFNRDESVNTQEIVVAPETLARLEQNFTLFYTGIQRRAETILHKQQRSASPQTLLQIKGLVPAFYDVLVEGNHEGCPYKNDNHTDCLCEVGYLLDRAWQLKRSLCDSISNSMLDTIYERAIAAGALGGKILGAGGGGYFLFYVPKAKQGVVTTALSDLGLSRLGFRFEPRGSHVIESEETERLINRQPPPVVDRNSPVEVNSLR